MDQFLTLKRAKIGPVFNFTAYIYIYGYILGHVWAILMVNNWATSFSHYKNRGFR